MSEASLTVSSKNYSSWSLRGWLLCKMAGLDFDERVAPIDDPATRAELLLLSPSFLVPCLEHGPVKVWDTLAIAEYLNEIKPEAGLLPADPVARAHCRAVCGEMHSGFANLRSALPMNLKATHPGFKVWAGAQADIDRVAAIWRECLQRYGGPYLFGAFTAVDAMFAPLATRLRTYELPISDTARGYVDAIYALPAFQTWLAAAIVEPWIVEDDEIDVIQGRSA